MSNFHIGQEVVALCDDDLIELKPYCINGGVKEGDIYTIRSLRGPLCKCTNHNFIDVGFLLGGKEMGHCEKCGTHGIKLNGIRWYPHPWFAPLQTASEESDMEQSIKEAFEKELFEV